MKKSINNRVAKLISLLEDEIAFFDDERQSMQGRYDNMSEKRQDGEAGEKLQSEILILDSIYDGLQTTLDACGEIENEDA